MDLSRFAVPTPLAPFERTVQPTRTVTDSGPPGFLPVPATTWTPLHVGHPTLLVPIGYAAQVVQFRPGPNRPPADAITGNLTQDGKSGMCYLQSTGTWFIYSSAAINFKVLDASDPQSAMLIAILQSLTSNVNVAQIGGANQTALDLTAKYVDITMAAPFAAGVGLASVEIIPAAATRYLYVRNISTAGQVISLGFGAAAVINTGVTLQVGEYHEQCTLNGIKIPAQNVRACASVAAALVAIQTGT